MRFASPDRTEGHRRTQHDLTQLHRGLRDGATQDQLVSRRRVHEKSPLVAKWRSPAGSQIGVPTPCSSCRSGTMGPGGDGESANHSSLPPGSSIEVCEGPHKHHFCLSTSRVIPRGRRDAWHHPQDRQTGSEEVRGRRCGTAACRAGRVLADPMACLKRGMVANRRLRPTGRPLRIRPDLWHANGPQSKGIAENLCGYAQRDLAVALLTDCTITGRPVDLRVANTAARAW